MTSPSFMDPPSASRRGMSPGSASRFETVNGGLGLAQQDYLMLIDEFQGRIGGARLVDIATELGVRSASASGTVRKLTQAGFVCHEPYSRLLLTDMGKAAVEVLGARCKPVAALLRALGLSEQAAKREAVRLQKGMSQETLTAIRRHLPKIKTACQNT